MILQRISGISAIAAGATYIIGFWVYFTVLGSAQYGSSEVPAGQHIEFLVANENMMLAWNSVIYLLNAILLICIIVGLHHRLRSAPEALTQIAAAFGLIWAGLLLAAGMVETISLQQIVILSDRDIEAAITLWRSSIVIGAALGGGNEITGGMWILLVSCAAVPVKALPLLLNLIGILIGAAGILSSIPVLSDLKVVFGLGFILWFFGVGITQIVLESPD